MSIEVEDAQNYELKSDLDAKEAMLVGASWRGIAELFRVVLSSVVVLILASILGPKAFGLVGMTDVLVQLFNIFLALGFDAAIIQQERMNNTILSSLFWLNIGFGVLLTIIGVAVSPLLAWFYHEPQVSSIFALLSLTFLIQSFSVIQRGLLARQMAFRKLAIVDMAASLLASIIGIVIALMGGSYWGLVFLQLGKNAIMAVGYWYSSPWRPKFILDIHSSTSSMRFSGNILFFNILNFFATRSDIILVGRLLGAEDLGFYLLANQLIFRPLDQILSVITRTLYPILAAIQHDVARVRDVFLKVMLALFSLVAPCLLLVAILTPVVVPFQLGEVWIPLIPIMIVWCFGGIRRIVTQQNGVIFLSMNRPDLQWKYQLISTPIVVSALIMGVQWGALGVSIFYNLAQLMVSIVSMYVAFRLINLRLWDYFKAFRFTTAALAVVVFVGVFLTRWGVANGWHTYMVLLTVSIVTGCLYITVLYLLDTQTRQLWAELRSWLLKRYMLLSPQ